MLALSTSWKSQQSPDGATLIRRAADLQVAAVELEYRIPERFCHGLRDALRETRLQVSSIHNYFPFPESDIPQERRAEVRPSGDLFLLSHPDIEERRRAVAYTRRTLEQAEAFHARAVVLHCGYVAMNIDRPRIREITARPAPSEADLALIHRLRRRRDALRGPHLDALLWSLDRLIPMADKYGVRLGLENRVGFHELPGPEEFEIIFREFDGAAIGYWHDAGHAHVPEVKAFFGDVNPFDLWSDRLVGLHLHDAIGPQDHQPPGRGEIDFESLLRRIPDGAIQVVELAPGTPDADAAEGIAHLRRIGFGAG